MKGTSKGNRIRSKRGLIMAGYKLYTFSKTGNKILICKAEDYMAARYILSAMCNEYPQWDFELHKIHERESEKILWRNSEGKVLGEYTCAKTGNLCPYKPYAFNKYPCQICEFNSLPYTKKRSDI